MEINIGSGNKTKLKIIKQFIMSHFIWNEDLIIIYTQGYSNKLLTHLGNGFVIILLLLLHNNSV